MVLLFDRENIPEDFFELVFATEQQAIVARLLVDYFKQNKQELSKTEMSLFAKTLHDGEMIARLSSPKYRGKKVKLSYNKRQFYDRILTPLRSMGIIQYDMYKKSYKLSEDFNKQMVRIGLLWLKELRKPSSSLIDN
ncbi:hypothetical protein KY334_05920 [Candidatus Woesearchaeota archaeon]|nr:hypothetical protein [Candidatus Woesearchaeota archaeon]